MIPIGYQPLLWHIMKYYAHFGHTEFILCLGYKDHIIKDYFVNYHEYVSNDFVLRGGVKSNLSKDIENWKITFVDTGVNSTTAQRLLAIQKYLDGEEMFLLNYADRLTDLNLADMIGSFDKDKMVGMMMAAKPTRRVHVTSINENYIITEMAALNKMEHLWVNAGYFILTQEIFKHIDPSGSLMEKTFPHLVADGRLGAYPHKGVSLTIDSYEEKHALDEMCRNGNTPWQVWDKNVSNLSANKSQSKFSGSKTALDCLLKIALLNEEIFLFANI